MNLRRPPIGSFASLPAGFAGLLLLVSGCGGSRSAVASVVSVQQNATASALAFSRCMRSHGVTTFPDPDSEGRFPPYSSVSAQAKQEAQSAQEACKNLLPSLSAGGVETRGAQQKLAFALQTARCMRAHGFLTYPDPSTSSPSSQGGGSRFDGTGIDIRAPRFQTAEVNCEKRARKALGLP